MEGHGWSLLSSPYVLPFVPLDCISRLCRKSGCSQHFYMSLSLRLIVFSADLCLLPRLMRQEMLSDNRLPLSLE